MKAVSLHLLILGGVVTSLLSYALLRHGILADPDSWAHWEASVSILEKGSYSLLDGDQAGVAYWPPLFPIYLALVQALLGKTGYSLTIAMCLLAYFNAMAWLAFLHSYFENSNGNRNRVALWLGTMFVILFVAWCSTELMSNFLLLLFVGLILILLTRVFGVSSIRYSALVVGLSLSCAAALLTHNSALVFVLAVAVVLLSESSRRLTDRLAASGAVSIGAVAPWLGTRMLLHQTHAHPLGSHPNYSLAGYIYQSVAGLGEFFSPTSRTPVWAAANVALGIGLIGFVVWGILATRRSERWPVGVPFLLASLAYVFLLVLFNLTWVNDPLNGRFLWFFPLSVIPGICLLVRRRSVYWLMLLYPLVLGLPAYRVARYSWTGIVPSGRMTKPGDLRIRVCYFLTAMKDGRPPLQCVRVYAPTYPWMARWKPGLPEGSQEAVKVE